MFCKKCGQELTGKQISYCSQKCSKLHLKSLYRKRNLEKIREYNKKYKTAFSKDGWGCKIMNIHLKENPTCEKCGTNKDVQIHHIKPVLFGGKHKNGNLLTLCRKHHHEFEKLTLDFFKPQ